MKCSTFSKLINHYNKFSVGVWKIFLCFNNCSINYISLSPGKVFLVLNWLFSELDTFLGLLKVGFVLFFLFLKFVKKSILIPSVTILLRMPEA